MPIETEFRDVDPRTIEIPAGRVAAERDEDSDITMDESMQRWGILQEPAVRDIEGKLVLIYGEGRIRKAIEAGQKLIRVKIFKVSSQDAELIALSENLARGAIRPGQFVQKIAELSSTEGFEPSQIARLINRPVRWVNDIIEVSKLDTEIVEDVVTGEISLEHAKELKRVEDVSKRLECYRLATQGKWSASALHQFVDRWVFKICDICGRHGPQLMKAGDQMLCLDCMRARYPQLAAELEKPAGEAAVTEDNLAAKTAADFAVPQKPVFPCHVCGHGFQEQEIQQILGCMECMQKIQRLFLMFEVYTGTNLRELSLKDLTGFQVVRRAG